MKRYLTVVSIAAAALLAVGCATTNESASSSAKVATAKVKADEEVMTGSRIPRASTDRLVKTTVQDKADEPTRSMGNVIGGSGR